MTEPERCLGVTLRGTPEGLPGDLAALNRLLSAMPELLQEAWWVLDQPEGGVVLTQRHLTVRRLPGEVLSGGPRRQSKVRRAEIQLGLKIVHVHLDHEGRPTEVEGAPLAPEHRRYAPRLMEAMTPLKVPGDPAVEEAVFVTPAQTPGARLILERLLRLGRDDAQVAEWGSEEEALVAVRLVRPPLYLLMRARDEDEDTTVYARHGASGLWVEWGYQHPLPDLAARVLAEAPEPVEVLVGGDGRWRSVPMPWPLRSIFGAIEARLPHTEVAFGGAPLTPGSQDLRFPVQLRLERAAPENPSLWLLDEDQLWRLEALVEQATSAQLNGLTLARLDGPEGRRHLLRERDRGRGALGVRISDLVGLEGFAPAPGTDRLFLPVARRLSPTLPMDALRRLLGLDQPGRVLLEDRPDGVRLIRVPEVDEHPLARFVEYLATTFRVALDHLMERSVFTVSAIEVDRPEHKAASAPYVAPPQRKMKLGTGKKRRRTRTEQKEEAAEQRPGLDEARLLREGARGLEVELSAGGVRNPEPWARLAELKARLDEPDEAALCQEVALFFGRRQEAEAAWRLVEFWRARVQDTPDTTEGLLELATREEMEQAEAGWLASRVLHALIAEAPLMDGLLARVVQLFTDGHLPVSRRLQWRLLAAAHLASGDTLGLTRAREAVLGDLNTRGLSEVYDVPRFVRYTLAMEGAEPETVGPAREAAAAAAQLQAARDLWTQVATSLEDMHVRSAFARVIFGVGMMRLGLPGEARALVEPVEAELMVHDRPTALTLRLYLARLAFVGEEQAEGSAQGAWAQAVRTVLNGVSNADRKMVDVIRTRSRWLAPTETASAERLHFSGPVMKRFERVDRNPSDAPEVLRKSLGDLWGVGGVQAVEHMLQVALKTGQEALISEVIQVGVEAVHQRFHTPQMSMRALGALIQAAVVVEEGAPVADLLEEIINRIPSVTTLTDLLMAVRPALEAMRRLGVDDSAAHLLERLESVAGRGHRLSPVVAGITAEGYWMMQQHEEARTIMERAFEAMTVPRMDRVARFQAACSWTDALRPWPSGERAAWCAQLMGSLDRFKDTFTSSNYFEAYKILVMERVADTVTDTKAFATSRVSGFLAAEEQGIRRRILTDWRAAVEGQI